MKVKLIELVSQIISGEWGDEDLEDTGISIIRTTNFKNDGSINFTNIEKRAILKKVFKDNIETWIIDQTKIESKKLLDGDIIIEKSGGGIGSPVGRVVYFINPDNNVYLCNNFTQTIRTDDTKIYPKYLFYKFKQLYINRTVLKYQNQTTGLLNLKLERYLKEEIEVPTFDMQYSIVTQLDTIQALIDNRRESILTLEKLLESKYFELFGDVVNNQKKFKSKKLKDIVKKDTVITYGIVQAGPHVVDGVPYIRSGDVKKGVIYKNDLLKTSIEISNKYSRTICQAGDVIITIRANVGDVAIIPKGMSGCNLTRGIALVSPNENLINSAFLYQTLSSDGFRFLLSKYIKGSTFKEISLAKLREIKIPIPDKTLQDKFALSFLELEKQKLQLKTSLETLQLLFHSLLQNAFTDHVRVNEEAIFSELVKKMSITDLKKEPNRIQFLINLFNENKFENTIDYSNAKEQLFELLNENAIIQNLNNENIELHLK